MIYGPRSNQVQVRLVQLSCLDATSCEALLRTRDSIIRAWRPARELARDAVLADANLFAVWKDLSRVALSAHSGTTRSAALEVTESIVMAELAKDRLLPEHYDVLVGPLGFLLDALEYLPSWWCEPGAVNLFCEMLAAGVSSDEARTSVSALV